MIRRARAGHSLARPGNPAIRALSSFFSFTSLSFWYCSSNSLKNAAFLPRTTTEPPRLLFAARRSEGATLGVADARDTVTQVMSAATDKVE